MQKIKVLTAFLLAIVFCCTAGLPVFASDMSDWEKRWDSAVQNVSAIAMTPGKDSTEMRFCWLSPLTVKNGFRCGTSADLTQQDAVPVQETVTWAAKKRCAVTVSALEPDTQYYYAYTKDGTWSEVYSFKTAGAQEPLTVLAISDVQLGRSGDWKEKSVLLHDIAGWDTTLDTAIQNDPAISLCISAGDQAEIGAQEKQYRLFLAPDVLRSIPIATTIGNHEFYFPCLNQHFDYANRQGGSIIHSLGDEPYYFTKDDVLFVVLDSNDPVVWDHEAVLEKAIRAYPDTRWRVVMMHHSLYSCEDSETKMPRLRKTLSPVLQKYGIDLVVSGHTHRYSRSKPIMDNAVSENGVVYLECGCASGCNGHACPDVLPGYTQYGYPAKDPVYSILTFDDTQIGIRSYAVIDGEAVLMDSGTVSGIAHTDARMSTLTRAMQKVFSVFGRMASVIFA